MALFLIKLAGILLFGCCLAGQAFDVPVLTAIGAGFMPLFAACMIQDWDLMVKKDRGKYIIYLSAAAVFVYIGTGLLLQRSDLAALEDTCLYTDFRHLVMAVLIPGFYLVLSRDWKVRVIPALVMAAALALPGFVLKVDGFYILSGQISLFHTMALCAGILYLWLSAKSQYEGLGWGLVLGPAVLLYIADSVFCLCFAVLFFVLYAFRRLPVYADVTAIVLWSSAVFGFWYENMWMAMACMVAGCLLFLQDAPLPALKISLKSRRWILASGIPAVYLVLLFVRYVLV